MLEKQINDLGDDASAYQSENDIHDRNSANLKEMRNTCINILLIACISKQCILMFMP
jgi:hypothetical protein